MKFGGIRRITADMLKGDARAVSGILDDVFNRLEAAFANLTPGDNFSGRIVRITVNRGTAITVQADQPRAVTVRAFDCGTLVAPTFGWRPVVRGAECLFEWSGGSDRATVELFVEENT